MTADRKPSSNGADAPVTLRAEKLIGGGRALAHHGGETWMVAGALPDEIVLAQPTRRRAGIVEADTLEVLESPHDARDRSPCPHSNRCGGCDWPHIKGEEAPVFKALAASDAARGVPVLSAMLGEVPVATSPLNYRLRARLHWDPDTRRLGFYETRSQNVTSIDSCTILSPDLMAAIPSIAGALAKRCPHRVDVEWLQSLEPGDAIAGLRSAKGGPVRLAPSWIPDREDLGRFVAGFHTLDRSGEIRAGWGATAVTMDLPIPLKVPIGAFFQGNRHLIRALSQRIAELAGSDPEPIYDLHAGVGFLAAAVLANGDREAHLVEPHWVAARAAALNLPAASVAVGQTAEYFVGSAGDLPGESLVITDPPRSGLSKPLRESLLRWQPRRILMLGCDPATWARDAGRLVTNGYQVRSIELFDLFPSTHHVEILALLERT